MRILQVCAVDFTAAHLLAPVMRGCRTAGWDVEFACADGGDAELLRREGFAYRAVPMTRQAAPLRLARAAAVLAGSLVRDRPDLIHTHTPAGGIVGRLAALAVPDVPLVHTFHGLPFAGEARSFTERSFLLLERLLALRTSWAFSQARGDATRVEALGMVRPGRIEVIGNGVDVRRFAPDPEARAVARRALEIPEGAVAVITIARLVREKGILDLADAAVSLADRSDIVFLIVGKALESDRSSVDRELAVHPVLRRLGPRWRLLGHREDIAELLRAADVFVLPTWREGLPRSVIEAMATGLPVIATDIPACRELVEDGVTGLLVPVQDHNALTQAIAQLADTPERRVAMGSRARGVATARHDEREIVARQLRVFDRLIASKR